MTAETSEAPIGGRALAFYCVPSICEYPRARFTPLLARRLELRSQRLDTVK